MATAATASIFQQATALLSQLTPEDISGDNSPEVVQLREAGIKLFGRAVLHQRYGEQDVVTFLREQAGHRELLRRLERLQKQINAEHAKQKADSQKAGINKQRQATLEAIEASAADALLLKDDGNAVEASDTIVAVRAENGADPSTAAPPRLPPRAKIIAETAEGEEELSAAARLARGSFRRACGVCKRSYSEVHHFYHKLCPECAEFNYEKRLQSADLTGYVAVVTGAACGLDTRLCSSYCVRAATSCALRAFRPTRRSALQMRRTRRHGARSSRSAVLWSSPTFVWSRPSARRSSASLAASTF